MNRAFYGMEAVAEFEEQREMIEEVKEMQNGGDE